MKQNKVYTGFRDIDNRIDGFETTNLTYIVSSPNQEKENLIYGIVNNLVKDKVPVAIFSKDIQATINKKLILTECSVVHNLTETSNYITSLQKYLSIYDYKRDIEEIEHIVKSTNGLRLIVIDLLQNIKLNKQISRIEQFEEICKRLKELASKVSIPIILLIDLPKEVEKRKNHKPILKDLEEYNITQYADNIIFVYRDDYYNKESEYYKTVEIKISKCRTNKIGTETLVVIDKKYVNLYRE